MRRAPTVEPDYRLVAGLVWSEVAKLVEGLANHPDMQFKNTAAARREIFAAGDHLIAALIKVKVITRPGSSLARRVDPAYRIWIEEIEADLADAPWKRRHRARQGRGIQPPGSQAVSMYH